MEKNLNLNIKFIQEKLVEGFEYTDTAKNKDLVLLIGNTGVGKSTTGNYLMGCEMVIEETDEGGEVISTVDKDSPFKIGHTSKSETLYATPVSRSSFSWCLVDCPGFLGNRTVEERIVESISTELAIRNGTQVKGIVVLAELSELEAVRSDKFLQLIRTLISIFKDPTEMINYTTFVITKKSVYVPIEIATKKVLVGIRQLSKYCETQLSAFQNPQVFLNNINEFSESEYLVASEYLKIMERKINEFVFIDPLDNGQSRQRVIERINLSKVKHISITINDFEFEKHVDSCRDQFNETINYLAKKINSITNSLIAEFYIIERLKYKKFQCENLIETAFIKQDELKYKAYTRNQVDECLIKWRNNFEYNDEEIQKISLKIESNKSKIMQCKSELDEINTEELVLYKCKSIDENAPLLGLFSYYEMDFSLDTNGRFRIIRIEKECENGKWHDEDNRSKYGIYRITYKSNYHARPAKASVKAYIYKKDDPKYASKIIQLNNQIKQLKENQTKNTIIIDELKEQNKNLLANIKNYQHKQSTQAGEWRNELSEVKSIIQKYKNEIRKIIISIKQAQKNGTKYIYQIEKISEQCEAVTKFSAMHEKFSSLAGNFAKEYRILKSKIHEYKGNFDIQDDIEHDQVIITMILSAQEIVPNHNATVSIIFENLKQAKQLQAELFNIGITELNTDDQAREIITSQSEEIRKFFINLSCEEYNMLIGENAFEKLVTKYSETISSSYNYSYSLHI